MRCRARRVKRHGWRLAPPASMAEGQFPSAYFALPSSLEAGKPASASGTMRCAEGTACSTGLCPAQSGVPVRNADSPYIMRCIVCTVNEILLCPAASRERLRSARVENLLRTTRGGRSSAELSPSCRLVGRYLHALRAFSDKIGLCVELCANGRKAGANVRRGFSGQDMGI